MPFGNILSENGGITLKTADNIEVKLSGSTLQKAGLKIFGVPHMGMRLRARYIFPLLDLQKDNIILDAGCGIGLYSLTLAKKGYKVHGIDADKEKINSAKKLAHSLNMDTDIVSFDTADLCQLPIKSKTYDRISCSEVIEHIKDDDMAVSELARVLKKGGILVLSVPSVIPIAKKMEDQFDHARPGYTKDQLISLLERNGFKVEQCIGWCRTFGLLAWKLNRKCFWSKILTALTFYPLYSLAMLDDIFTPKDGATLGYVVKARKKSE
jgi:ubiquinone/menaquinone biosynthesis C-methylase UbiE